MLIEGWLQMVIVQLQDLRPDFKKNTIELMNLKTHSYIHLESSQYAS